MRDEAAQRGLVTFGERIADKPRQDCWLSLILLTTRTARACNMGRLADDAEDRNIAAV